MNPSFSATSGRRCYRSNGQQDGAAVKHRDVRIGETCTQAELAAGEEPVGGVHVKEKCTKTMQGRALTIERNLFRKVGQDEKNFVDETRVTILRAHGQNGVDLN